MSSSAHPSARRRSLRAFLQARPRRLWFVLLIGLGSIVAWSLFGSGATAPVYRLARVEQSALVQAVAATGQLTRPAEIEAKVGEAEIGQLREGQPVRFALAVRSDREFAGTVRAIRSIESGRYAVTIAVATPDRRWRAGTAMTIRFIVAERPAALVVPNAALRFRPPGEPGKNATQPTLEQRQLADLNPGTETGRLFVLRAGRPAAIPVLVGVSDGARTEILGGEVKPGDEVVVERQLGEAPVAYD